MALALVLVATVVICTGIAARLAFSSHPQRGSPSPIPRPRVKVAIARQGDLPTYVRALGTIEASKRVVIRPRVDGVILRVLFQEGEFVSANTPLFEIDPTLYRTQAQQAAAALSKDEASLSRATKDLERGTELASRGVQSRSTMDQLHATAAEFDATVAADRAVLAAAQAQLGWTIIRAPIAGRIGKRLFDEGNLVRSADNVALADIVQIDPCQLIFAIPEEQLEPLRAMLANGDLPIEIRALDDRKVLAQSHSALLYNAVDSTTGSIRMRAMVDNHDWKLWPGQSVNVRVTVAQPKPTVIVPVGAVFQARTGAAVYVVTEHNRLALRPVRLGGTSEDTVGIESGVESGEKVLIADQQRFAPGSEIIPEVASP
jgi:multidrug efflux system membrane fusion protein